MNVWPATLRFPVRDAPSFVPTLNMTRPFPVPDAPLVTAIHAAFDAAVHEQVFADAVTSMAPGPPPAATVCPPG